MPAAASVVLVRSAQRLRATTTRLWEGRYSLVDHLLRVLCQASALVVLAVFVLLIAVLVWHSRTALATLGLGFFSHSRWDPEPSHRQLGCLALAYGTLATSAIALVLAAPLGIGAAVYLAQIAPRRLRAIGSLLVEILAAIPSVVLGFWGLFVLAPALQQLYSALGGPNQGGQGILAAGIILAIMIVPGVASVSFAVIRAVPSSQRDAALALGATRWQSIRTVVMPQARAGLVGACFLALGRALGETMAVLMLVGSRAEISLSPFALGNTIASAIAGEFTEATYDLYLSALVELGLVLLLVSVAVSSLARLLIWKVTRPEVFPTPPGAPAAPPGENLLHQGPPLPPPTTADALPRQRPDNRAARWLDRMMTGALGLCFLAVVSVLVLILGYLFVQGRTALSWEFFTQIPAPRGQAGGGLANAIYGSFLMVALATLAAAPVGVLAAVYLAEYRSRRLAPVVRFVSELLAGVPSVVIGLFGYLLVVRPMRTFSGWAGAFTLAVLMLPAVVRASEQALRRTPVSLRQASHALGASRWQSLVRVVIPASLPGILTAVLLAVARILGETAPLLLTASNNWFWPSSAGDFMPSLPVYLFSYAISPYQDWNRQAAGAALVLVAMVLLLHLGVRLLSGRRQVPD